MNSKEHPSLHFLRRNALLSAGLLLFVFLASATSLFLLMKDPVDEVKKKIISVSRQSFNLQVTERGVIRPAQVLSIKSRLSGNQSKLVWLVDEGEVISKGQLIARFDTKPFMDKMEKAEQQMTDARAQLAVAIKSIELQKEEENSKIEAAKRDLEIKNIQANELKNGAGPLKRQQLEQKVAKSLRTQAIANSELEDIRPLLEKGHVTLREFAKGEDNLIAAAESLTIARAELHNFEKYEWPRILREAEVIEEGARMDLSRVIRTAELIIQKFTSELEKARRDKIVKEKLLTKAKKDVTVCDVYSPADGILLYALIPSVSSKRKIQIGDSIWVGQTFLEVPDTRELVVEINVREIDVAKLKVGMMAEVVLDAFPGQIFPGELVAVDALAQKKKDEGVRRFFSRIKLLETSSRIHIGMSANVKITYLELQDVPVIPVSAIVYKSGMATITQMVDGQKKQVKVKLGGSGIQWAQVIEGVEEGDRIVVENL